MYTHMTHEWSFVFQRCLLMLQKIITPSDPISMHNHLPVIEVILVIVILSHSNSPTDKDDDSVHTAHLLKIRST